MTKLMAMGFFIIINIGGTIKQGHQISTFRTDGIHVRGDLLAGVNIM